MNVEIDGIVGNVEVKADKKTGLPVLNVLLMDNKGKQVKARVKQVDDKVSMLKFGHPVQLRFENLDYLMSEFGNLSFGCESARVINVPAAKIVNG